MKKGAFTRLVKPFARIWTRAKAYWLGCTRNPRYPSFASAHSYGACFATGNGLAHLRSASALGRKAAFTLAEVLITLTILGVVAAITVPSLQKMNYKRTQVSRMAKGYASLEKAVTNIATNTNCIGKDIECTGLLNIDGDVELQKKFAELANFRVSKNGEGIVAIKALNTSSTDPANYVNVFVTTPDNIAYSISSTGVFRSDVINGVPQYKKALLVTIFTDKNNLYNSEGKIIKWSSGMGRSDAVMGRSAFKFVVYDTFKVEPLFQTWNCAATALSKIGCENAIAKCDPSQPVDKGCTDSHGVACAARIICEGWKMNY